MTGTFEYEKGDVQYRTSTFFRYNATYPYYLTPFGALTQMRCSQIPEFKPDNWYKDMAKKVTARISTPLPPRS